MNKRQYEYYTYQVEPIEVAIATAHNEEPEQTITGYAYRIFDVYMSGGDHESYDWYETANEAEIAAEDMIDILNEGREPDYA